MRKRKVITLITLVFCLALLAQKNERDIYLDSLAKHIQFKYKGLAFKKGTLDVVKKIQAYIKNNNNNYLVEVHTCSVGKATDNQKLTDKRAKVLEELFLKQGIDSSRIVIMGLGERNPCCITRTRATRYLNRRVEFSKISKDEIKKLKRDK
ncbi:OmpA family protein [Tenacibaculum amylolyticum]|uniref:OmpA family protein n=1 Tax=Tenacibaculum amylolyticum TaxID=104269 RepID=UPI003892D25F